jgi:hypothetical protein
VNRVFIIDFSLCNKKLSTHAPTKTSKNNSRQNTLQKIKNIFVCRSSLEADPNQWEARLPNGLVKGHAYSITGVRVIDGPRGKIPLLRIRNPWGWYFKFILF